VVDEAGRGVEAGVAGGLEGARRADADLLVDVLADRGAVDQAVEDVAEAVGARVDHRDDGLVEGDAQDLAVGHRHVVGGEAELAGRRQGHRDVVADDVGQVVVGEREVHADGVDREVDAGDGVDRGVAGAALGDDQRLEGAEVLGDVAELVADVLELGDEVRGDLEQAIVEVAGDERGRAGHRVLDRAVGQGRDQLVDDVAGRVVGRVGRVDEAVDHRADRARHVGGEVVVALEVELALGRQRHRGVIGARARARAGARVGVAGGGGRATGGGSGSEEEGDREVARGHHGLELRRGWRGLLSDL
jgi:hypothetical protein